MQVGLGLIPCTPEQVSHDRIRHPLNNLVGSVGISRSEVDHSKHLDFVPHQGPTNSCVGQWHSSAIYLAGQVQGNPVKRPSRRWSYTVARYMRTPGKLEDLGSSAHLMCVGTERHGIVAEDRLPFDPAAINEPPPFDADIAGQDALFTGYYRAQADAYSLRLALEQGHFPGIAITTTDNFVDYSGGVYSDLAGEFRGYHMLTLVGYRPGAFLVLNSWGDSWGVGGFCWMADSFVCGPHVFDRYVITAAPKGAL